MLDERQIELRERIESAVENIADRRVVYVSEWLGWLPYGCYHWVEVNGQEIADLPSDWQRSDLQALEQFGFLRRLEEWQDPADEYHLTITYEVAAACDISAPPDQEA